MIGHDFRRVREVIPDSSNDQVIIKHVMMPRVDLFGESGRIILFTRQEFDSVIHDMVKDKREQLKLFSPSMERRFPHLGDLEVQMYLRHTMHDCT